MKEKAERDVLTSTVAYHLRPTVTVTETQSVEGAHASDITILLGSHANEMISHSPLARPLPASPNDWHLLSHVHYCCSFSRYFPVGCFVHFWYLILLVHVCSSWSLKSPEGRWSVHSTDCFLFLFNHPMSSSSLISLFIPVDITHLSEVLT